MLIKKWKEIEGDPTMVLHCWKEDGKKMRAQFFHSRKHTNKADPYPWLLVIEVFAPPNPGDPPQHDIQPVAVLCEDECDARKCWEHLCKSALGDLKKKDITDPIKEISGPGLGIDKDDKHKGDKGGDPIEVITGPGTNAPPA